MVAHDHDCKCLANGPSWPLHGSNENGRHFGMNHFPESEDTVRFPGSMEGVPHLLWALPQ